MGGIRAVALQGQADSDPESTIRRGLSDERATQPPHPLANSTEAEMRRAAGDARQHRFRCADAVILNAQRHAVAGNVESQNHPASLRVAVDIGERLPAHCLEHPPRLRWLLTAPR